MKKHVSVFMLMARSTIYKIIGLFTFTFALECFLFLRTMKQGTFGGSYGLEIIIEKSYLVWILAVSFLLLTVFLCLTGYETSSKSGYTLMRLSITERQILLWQSIYNILCYITFWMLHILTLFLLCQIYMQNALPEHITSQTVFLAFYRSDLLHALLPFDDIWGWVRNILLVIALGICSARFPYASRKGEKRFSIILLVCFTVGFFIRPLGDYSSVSMVIAASMTTIAFELYETFKKEVPNNET